MEVEWEEKVVSLRSCSWDEWQQLTSWDYASSNVVAYASLSCGLVHFLAASNRHRRIKYVLKIRIGDSY